MVISTNLLIYLILFPIGQLLDYYTTYLGLGNMPKEEIQRRELNPIARRHIHNKKLILTIKMLLVSLLLLFVLFHPEHILALKVLTIFTLTTVASNIQSYWAEKHNKSSDLQISILKKLGTPKRFWYIAVTGVSLGFSIGIALLLP